jgi:acetyl-CoA synthetase
MTQPEQASFFKPPVDFVRQANISGMGSYQSLCAEADQDYPAFWARLAREHISWQTPFTEILDDSNAPFFKWFADITAWIAMWRLAWDRRSPLSSNPRMAG